MLIQAQGVGIGIKGGANFANQDIEDIDIETVTDDHIGAYLNIICHRVWHNSYSFNILLMEASGIT